MRHCLRSRGLWKFVDGTTELAADATAQQKTQFEEAQAKAFGMIVMGMASSQIYLISSTESPVVAWRLLREHFQRDTLNNRIYLKKKYFRMEMSEGRSIEDHLKDMKEITDQLAAINSPVTEEDQVVTLLGSLPPSYSTLVTALETREGQLTLAVVQQALIHEQLKRKECAAVESVPDNSAMLGTTNKKKGFQHPKQKKERRQVKCYSCGKVGHIMKECWKRKEDNGRRDHSAKLSEIQEDQESNDGVALTAYPSDRSAKCKDWVIDSGASRHMTWDSSILVDLKQLEKPEFIKLGDDYELPATARGKVNLSLAVNGKACMVTLNDVLLVPDLGTNLFSVKAATKRGYQVSFDVEKCAITNSSGKKVAFGTMCGNMYKLDCSVSHQASVAENKIKDIDLWHRRLGHISGETLEKMSKLGVVKGLTLKDKEEPSFCEGCICGKITRQPGKPVGEIRTKRCLELVHSDVWGPTNPESFSGNRWFITFTDDYSRCTYVYFMKNKDEALQKFRDYEATAVGETGLNIGILRTDNGGEYTSSEFNKYLKSRKIHHQVTVPHTPDQNGVAERVNRTLTEKARAMLYHADLPRKYWAEAILTAAYLKNRTPTRSIGYDTTPYERWYGRKPEVEKLRVFGCTAYAKVPDAQRKKMDSKAIKLRFVGYAVNSKGYRLLDVETGKIYIKRDVIFNENDFEKKTVRAQPTGEIELPSEVNVDKELTGERPRRERRQPIRYGIDEYVGCANLAYSTGEPSTMEEAMLSPDADKWKKAAQSEYNSLIDNGTWELVPLPEGKKTIGCRWVFKIKYKEDGDIERYKCRLVAKGYSQSQGIDYEETFSPVVRYSSIRTLLALAAQKKLEVHQMDVETAFLNGDLEEEIYMDQPDGFKEDETLVCRLKKSLYGLKQSPRCWNKKLTNFLIEEGFEQSKADPCVFVKVEEGRLSVIEAYVDDLIMMTEDDVTKLKKLLSSEFKMKDLGQIHFCVGICIKRTEDGEYQIHQKPYIESVLKRFGMEDAKEVSTPADVNVKLEQDDGFSKPVDPVEYKSMLGCLLYIAMGTRPDIAYAVAAVCRYSSSPTELHMTALKRILRYLKRTKELSLHYTQQNSNLVCYSDADWAGDRDDRKSTTGNVHLLGNGAISWLSKKQSTVALSTSEAEYIALCSATQETVHLRSLLSDLGFKQEVPTRTFEDNQGAISLARNPVAHKRTKHIDVKYHFIREAVENRIIALEYCPTDEMTADLCTKPIPRYQFERLRFKLGIY